ncbi:Ger(x)C family spore germination protein [Bacillus salitolerans]|uniref:Ger(X)C family spore germination protein n=1 Tax=Bacillus salitolerans TaxID=1437434 RepID=A0ABW4LV04_9BACI
MKQWTSLSLLFVILILLSGCGDKIEIEEEGFVVALGMDLPEEEDAKGIDVTFKLANPIPGQQGGTQEQGKEQEEAVVITIRAPDILSARDLANTSETRRLNYYHTKAIIIGEELARSNEFLNLVSSIQRERQVRGEMTIMVSKERAAEYLRKSQSALEASPHKFYDFMERRWKKNALVPDSTMQTFFHGIEADKGGILASYTTTERSKTNKAGNEDEYLPGQVDIEGGTEIQLIGAAVFQDGKMVSTLTGEETRFALMFRPDIDPEQMIFTYVDPLDPDHRIVIKGYTLGTDIDVDLKDSIPKLHVTIDMEVRILSIPSMVNYVEDIEKQRLLKEHIESELERKGMNLVKKSQEEIKGDPFYWALAVRKKFLTIKEFEDFNWREKYPISHISLTYDVNIRDFGKKLRPHTEHEIRDKD